MRFVFRSTSYFYFSTFNYTYFSSSKTLSWAPLAPLSICIAAVSLFSVSSNSSYFIWSSGFDTLYCNCSSISRKRSRSVVRMFFSPRFFAYSSLNLDANFLRALSRRLILFSCSIRMKSSAISLTPVRTGRSWNSSKSRSKFILLKAAWIFGSYSSRIVLSWRSRRESS